MANSICNNLTMLEDESEPSVFNYLSSTTDDDSVFSIEEFQSRSYKKRISFSSRHSRQRSTPYCRTISSNKKNKKITYEFKNVEIDESIRADMTKDLKERYSEALIEIENLQSEISILRSNTSTSTTPRMVRRKSMQSSMIKTCLFRNSSGVLNPNYNRPNSTRSSIFGADSTCNTIDIADINNIPGTSRDFFIANPFLTKEQLKLPSPELNKSACASQNTESPLLSFQSDKKRNKISTFLHKFITCPNIKSSSKMKGENKAYFDNRSNKISPLPRVTLSTPSTTKSSAHLFYRKSLNDIWKIPPSNYENLLKDMLECCEEFNKKIRVLTNEYNIQHTNNNNDVFNNNAT